MNAIVTENDVTPADCWPGSIGFLTNVMDPGLRPAGMTARASGFFQGRLRGALDKRVGMLLGFLQSFFR
jgi:hypothetical protein